MLPILACENAVGPNKISTPQIIAALNGVLNNISSSLLELPVSNAGVATQFSPAGELVAQSAVVLRIVKPPPHEVGGSSWLEVVLDLTVGCSLSSELKRDRT